MPFFGCRVRRGPRSLLAAVCFCAFFAAAYGQQTIHVPADQPSIKAGISAANKGDTVLVAPGTYKEYIDFQGKAITVTSSGGAAVTIIDSGSVSGTATVNFLNGELRTSVLSGFTIQGGGNANAPGTVPFGGIYVANSAPTILNNTITSNTCSGVTVSQGAALVQGNTISGTLAVNGNCPYAGAGVLLTGNSTVKGISGSTVTGNMIQNNVQGLYAGGIVVEGADSQVLQNNTISGNIGTNAGGIFLQSAASANVLGNTISGNTGGCGGGISVDSAESLLIESNLMHGNSGGCAGGITIKNTQTLSIVENVVYGNAAVSGSSAAAGGINILVPGASVGPFTGTIANNSMSGNTLGSYTAGESATELNLGGNLGQYVVINNILVGTSSSVPTTNCSLSNNKYSLNPLVFDRNDLYNGQGGANYGGACPDQNGTFGNISADPQFVNSTAGNFQLKAGSPAIDAGNNSAPRLAAADASGAARQQDATAKGYPIVDMGAYEVAGALDGQPAVLTLTPSSYGSDPGLSLTAAFFSSAGTASGPFTLYMDAVPISTTIVQQQPLPPFPPPGDQLATFPPSGITPGRHAFTASYSGSGTLTPAASVKLYATAELYGPYLTLSSSPNPSDNTQNVIFTMKITSPDGALLSPVTVDAYYPQQQTPGYPIIPDIIVPIGTVIPNAAGVATITYNALDLGTDPILANYSGDATHYPVTALLSQNVVFVPNTPPSFTSSLNPSGYGVPITFTLILYSQTLTSPAPSGTVVFSDGVTVLGTSPFYSFTGATNIASLNVSMLAPGNHTITASYFAPGSTTASTISLIQIVNPGLSATTTNMTLCVGPSTYCPATGGPVSAPYLTGLSENYGQTLNEGTQVVPGDGVALMGTISFVDVNSGKTTTICTIPVGTGNFCPPSFNNFYLPGDNIITAVYSGDATHLSSSSASITVTIMPDLTSGFMSSSAIPPTNSLQCPPAGSPASTYAYAPYLFTAYFG